MRKSLTFVHCQQQLSFLCLHSDNMEGQGSSQKRILVSGFGSFGMHSVNPSWLAVQDLKTNWDRPEELFIEEILVAYDYVKVEIPKLWTELKPDLVIHVGVSSLEAGTIHLETCAHSNGYIRLDVKSCCGPINEHSTECLKTNLNVEEIIEDCQDSFPRIKMSTNAGRFCTTRWIEDESVVKRAIKLWPNITKVINHWQSLCKSKRPKNNKSYETLVGHHLDEAIPVKMQFFQDVASELEGFLQLFQTNNPMVPFLEKALVDVLHTFMQMVVKPDVLDQANSSFKLIKLDLTNSENLLPCELIGNAGLSLR